MTGDDTTGGRAVSRARLVYAAWAVVFVVSFAAGGATLATLADYETVGGNDDPNVVQVAANWDGPVANDPANQSVANDESTSVGNSGGNATPAQTSTPAPSPTPTTPQPSPDCPERGNATEKCRNRGSSPGSGGGQR